jgi:hypothetical protein
MFPNIIKTYISASLFPQSSIIKTQVRCRVEPCPRSQMLHFRKHWFAYFPINIDTRKDKRTSIYGSLKLCTGTLNWIEFNIPMTVHHNQRYKFYCDKHLLRNILKPFIPCCVLVLTNSVAQEPEGSSPHSQQPATGPCPETVESNSHTPPKPISLKSILIPSSHLRLSLPSGLFPSGFPTKTLYTFLSSPMRATCPAHHIHLDLTWLT